MTGVSESSQQSSNLKDEGYSILFFLWAGHLIIPTWLRVFHGMKISSTVLKK
ncbi:hypothetical protein ACK3F5_03845 [Photorhabdus asymbiotica UENP]